MKLTPTELRVLQAFEEGQWSLASDIRRKAGIATYLRLFAVIDLLVSEGLVREDPNPTNNVWMTRTAAGTQAIAAAKRSEVAA